MLVYHSTLGLRTECFVWYIVGSCLLKRLVLEFENRTKNRVSFVAREICVGMVVRIFVVR